jgi:cytoskeletal protein RodZ
VDHLDFGRYLSQQRELRGLSRDTVAISTKIPMTMIAALEEGQVGRLPGRVFVINYVRAYAQVIGLSPEEAVLRYEEVDKSQTVLSPATLERTRKRKAWLILSGVLVVIAGAGYSAFWMLAHRPHP